MTETRGTRSLFGVLLGSPMCRLCCQQIVPVDSQSAIDADTSVPIVSDEVVPSKPISAWTPQRRMRSGGLDDIGFDSNAPDTVVTVGPDFFEESSIAAIAVLREREAREARKKKFETDAASTQYMISAATLVPRDVDMDEWEVPPSPPPSSVSSPFPMMPSLPSTPIPSATLAGRALALLDAESEDSFPVGPSLSSMPTPLFDVSATL